MAKNEVNKAEQYRKERKARIAKEAKKSTKKQISSKSSKVAGIVVAVVLCVAILTGIFAVVINQSGVIQKNRTAFMVGDEKVSQTEYQFYYMSAYNNINYYSQMYAQYGMSMGPDSTKSLSQQEYDNSFGTMEGVEEGQKVTWADYIEHSAQESIASIKSCIKQAKAAGIELSAEDIAEVDKQIEELRENAKTYSQSSTYSLSAFLKVNYGKGMNEKSYRKILLDQKLAEVYRENKTEEYRDALTTKEINKEYKDNIDSYATITYRKYSVNAEKVTSKDENGEETSAVTDATMKDAKVIADKIAAATNEDEFKALVSENEQAAKNKDYKKFITDNSLTLTTDASVSDATGSSSDEKFTSWITSAKTAVSSTYVVENASTGYDVYMMVEPLHKAATYQTYDARHILVNFTEESNDEDQSSLGTEEPTTHIHTDEEGNTVIHSEGHEDETQAESTSSVEETTKAPVEVKTLDISKYSDVTIDLGVDADTAKDKESYKKAQDILEEYLKGDRTASAFGALAEKYSDDTGSNENGGLYEGTKIGDFVKPFEQWCLKDGRKAGDVGIVEYEGENYQGYHVLYFVGLNDVKWDDPVKDNLASEKYSEAAHELLHTDEFKITGENEKAITSVGEFLDSLMASAARNQSAQ